MSFKALTKLAAAAAIAVSSLSASAAPSITNSDGTFDPFGGFDWASAGIAFTKGFTGADNSLFDLYYTAWAVQVQDTSGGGLGGGFLDGKADGLRNSTLGDFLANQTKTYEYTIVAKINEKVNTCSLPSGFECSFQVLGGEFWIYYDTNTLGGAAGTAANIGAGTGLTDGVLVIAGSFGVQATPNTFSQLTGGQVDLSGVVTYTNNTYINPNLLNTDAQSTLQLKKTNATFPSTFKTGADLGEGTIAAGTGLGQVQLQADANQTFAIPEPGLLALTGIGLLGLGLRGRGKKQA